MGEKKRKLYKRIFWVWPYQIGSIENYLESQARKGFYFAGTEGPRYIFLKGKPTGRRYQVNIIDKENDIKEKFTKEGWKYLGKTRRLQYFYTDDTNVDKVEIGDSATLDLIKKTTIPYMALMAIIMILLSIFLFFRPLIEMVEGGLCELTASKAGNMVMALAIMVCILSEIMRFVKFNVDNTTRVRNGQWIVYSKYEEEIKGMLLYCVIMLGAILITAVFVAAETFALSMLILGIILLIFVALFFALKLMDSPVLKRIKENERARSAFGMLLCLFVVAVVLISAFAVGIRLVVNAIDSKKAIPYGLKDMGYELVENDNRYIVSNKVKTKNFLYSRTTYLEVLYDKDVNASLTYISYENHKFFTKGMCTKWVSNLISKGVNIKACTNDIVDSWNADEVFYIENYEDTGDNVILVEYDTKVYVLPESITDIESFKEALKSE